VSKTRISCNQTLQNLQGLVAGFLRKHPRNGMNMGVFGTWHGFCHIPRRNDQLTTMNQSNISNPKKILLVDDNRHMTQILGHVLSEAGYMTESQNDSRQALQTARSFMPDLAILDVDMPNMDGGDVMRQFRENEDLRDVHVIFLTALAKGQDPWLQSDNKKEIILPKPISILELKNHIEHALGKTA
jgi:CheY-like chemotaxis protein